MSDIKCPICNKPMQISYPSARGYHYCYNCGISSGGIAYKVLDRTRKALDVAQKAMLEIHYRAPSIKVADKILTEALKQIKTALEQKERQ